MHKVFQQMYKLASGVWMKTSNFGNKSRKLFDLGTATIASLPLLVPLFSHCNHSGAAKGVL
jgi:hypothetical protein